jgi:hypothetical protein
MTAIMARRPFAISSQNSWSSQPGPRGQPRLHAENMPMITIMARRPFAISYTQRTCR